MTTTKLTELEAVNAILTSAGLPFIASLPPFDQDPVIAYDILKEKRRQHLARGWSFNTEYCVTYSPSAGLIQVPEAVVSIVPAGISEGRRFSLRDVTVYDRDENTTTFEDDIEVDQVLLLDWDETPHLFRVLVQHDSTVEFLNRNFPDSPNIPGARASAALALAEFQRSDAEADESNLFRNPEIAQIAYRPSSGDSVYL